VIGIALQMQWVLAASNIRYYLPFRRHIDIVRSNGSVISFVYNNVSVASSKSTCFEKMEDKLIS
jgi:hypothetical protein